MTVVNDRIVKATDSELYSYWSKRFVDIMDYETYKRQCKRLGTEVVEDDSITSNK